MKKLKINFALFNNLIVTSFFVCIFSFPKRNKINSFSSLTSILMHNFSVFNDRSFHLLYLIKVLVTLVTDLFQFTFSIDTNPIGNLWGVWGVSCHEPGEASVPCPEEPEQAPHPAHQLQAETIIEIFIYSVPYKGITFCFCHLRIEILQNLIFNNNKHDSFVVLPELVLLSGSHPAVHLPHTLLRLTIITIISKLAV